ncbi:hypothetical protein [Burkholderia sp. BCC1999]|uniref:oxidoreductase n=1 Tax=Burkholderia sp. BCC1999 TaxID=2817448 RepID=UPI002AC34790|nr:hypothetical protein [Burkholderia sp. BCC1999]
MSTLFAPVSLGDMVLANRIVMAPMTRSRAGAGDVPHELHATSYAQRASTGLIIAKVRIRASTARATAERRHPYARANHRLANRHRCRSSCRWKDRSAADARRPDRAPLQ